jgi:hypothetical protein
MELEVFDNLIPEHLVDYYELSILGKTPIPEQMMNPIVDLRCRYEGTGLEDGVYPLSFTHVLKSHTALSPHLENFGLIPQIVCSEIGRTLREILLARIYLLVPYKTNLEHYAPHTDLPFDHWVVLYYVNDSDGDTVFFDNGHIVKSVSPKRGRAVLFNGNILHGGGIPKSNPRSIVNFDITML